MTSSQKNYKEKKRELLFDLVFNALNANQKQQLLCENKSLETSPLESSEEKKKVEEEEIKFLFHIISNIFSKCCNPHSLSFLSFSQIATILLSLSHPSPLNIHRNPHMLALNRLSCHRQSETIAPIYTQPRILISELSILTLIKLERTDTRNSPPTMLSTLINLGKTIIIRGRTCTVLESHTLN